MKDTKPIESLYPDLVYTGGLQAVVRQRLEGKLAGLEVNGFGTGQGYVWVQFGSRANQVFLQLDERKFNFDFFVNGQTVAVGATPNLDEALTSILYWLSSSCSAESLFSKFPFTKRKAARVPPER